MEAQDKRLLWDTGYEVIRALEVESGMLASGKDELYGCIFGRDSLISALLLMRAYEKNGDAYFLDLARKILLNLALLQGKEENIESGEESGKIIHEFRPDKHEHLTAHAERPWYLYPDKTMKSYDSVDSTPLFLLAAHAYMRASGTDYLPVIEKLLPHVKAGLSWIVTHGDSNGDGLIDYRFHEKRTYGGLVVQSWMDSHDSAFHENGKMGEYPIAPVEVQGYAWAALRLWADHFHEKESVFAEMLEWRAERLKKNFNERFVLAEDFSIAFAIDGEGRRMKSARSSMGHILWSSYEKGGLRESILDERFIPRLAERLMREDIFEPKGGLRTLTTHSRKFSPQSYHNGSIWPHDTEMVAVGLEEFGYAKDAERIREALFSAYRHFKTPLEFFGFDGNAYSDYLLPSGQRACQRQAWSAAALLSALSGMHAAAETAEELVAERP